MIPSDSPRGGRETSPGALLAVVCLFVVAGFEWLLRGRLGVKYASTIGVLLTPVAGKYYGAYVFNALVTVTFVVLATWVFLRLSGRGGLVSLGLPAHGSWRFWTGLLAGFLPGMVVALLMAATGFGSVYVQGADGAAGLVAVRVAWVFTGVLVAAGFALHATWPTRHSSGRSRPLRGNSVAILPAIPLPREIGSGFARDMSHRPGCGRNSKLSWRSWLRFVDGK